MAQISDHFDGKRFFNARTRPRGSFWDFLKWMFSHHRMAWQGMEPQQAPAPSQRNKPGQIQVIYVNHMTFLVQMAGVNILTDPIWSERDSPVQWAGPKRQNPPGLAWEDLPAIDLVLLSHNHYDHLDKQTLLKLGDKNRPLVLTPLGNENYLKFLKGVPIKAMDWWDQIKPFRGLEITCVPSHHFSSRSPFDHNRALWGGFVLKARKKSVYFAGDTGWDRHFQEVASRFPKLDLAILPSGAYLPAWFMQDIHINPEEAVRAFKILRARCGIACHFGTFQLGDDVPQQVISGIEEARKDFKVKPDQFIIGQNGQDWNF